MNKHQHDPITPKWLRLASTWVHRFDIGFIPIAIAVSLLAPPAAILMATISVSINFLWIGTTSAQAVVARNRYRLLETIYYCRNFWTNTALQKTATRISFTCTRCIYFSWSWCCTDYSRPQGRPQRRTRFASYWRRCRCCAGIRFQWYHS